MGARRAARPAGGCGRGDARRAAPGRRAVGAGGDLRAAVGRRRRVVRRASPGPAVSGDIFAGQPTDADLLAQLYDLEHDAVVEDIIFYREQTRHAGHTVLDLGCGSGRLLRTFAAGKARRIVGLDGSAALLRRAEARSAAE